MVIQYSHVTIAYGAETAVQDISFGLEPGKVLCIVGESGSGKSTIIKAPLGLLGPGGAVIEGNIRYEGLNLPELAPARLRPLAGPGIAMVFQNSETSFMPLRTFGAQIYEALAAHISISRKEADEQTASVLGQLGFTKPKKILASRPFEVSGGMNQRVALSLPFLLRPRLLLADEPTSALDALTGRAVLKELDRLRQEAGTAIILVTHDMGVAKRMADDILVLRQGRTEEYGPAGEVLKRPRSAYTQELLAAAPVLKPSPLGKVAAEG